MAAEKKIPIIRFKGFEGEWEDIKLTDIYNFQYGYFNNNPSDGGQYPVYGANGIIGKYSKYNAESSVVIGHMGEYAGSVIWAEGKHFVTYNGTISTVKNDRINSKFGFYLLSKLNINKICGGSGQPFLSYDTLEKIQSYISTSLPEQTQIGTYFQNLDSLISLHQRKYDKLLTVKKAMLEKMFPKEGADVPEIRFKGFEGKWEKKFLGDEVNFFSGLTYSPSSVVKTGGTFVLRSSNVKNGEVVEADNVYVDSEVVNCDNVVVGDIIVVVRNGSRSLIGKHAQIKRQMDNTVIGAFMTGIHSKQPGFINSLLDTTQFNKEIEKNLGATINQITTGAFNKMQFKFPIEDEQVKIGTFFQNLDTQISKHQKQLEKLKNIKKACLEKMFV